MNGAEFMAMKMQQANLKKELDAIKKSERPEHLPQEIWDAQIKAIESALADLEDELRPTITLAKTALVDIYRRDVEYLLDCMGHPEALVTDESRLSDFYSPVEYKTREAAQAAMERDLGLSLQLDVGMTLVEAVLKLKEYGKR